MPSAPSDRYVRVYYSIIGDERFANVYHDARTLGTWLQLLLVADAMFPADAPIPAYVHRASFVVLVKAGLIENAPHQHYRVHGLASEREVRSHSARNAAAVRWQSEGNATASATGMPRTEQNRTEEQSTEEHDVPALTTVIDYLEERTGRAWHFRPGSKLWDDLDADVRTVPLDELMAAYRALPNRRADFASLIYGAHNALFPLNGSTVVKTDPAEQKRANARAILAAASDEVH